MSSRLHASGTPLRPCILVAILKRTFAMRLFCAWYTSDQSSFQHTAGYIAYHHSQTSAVLPDTSFFKSTSLTTGAAAQCPDNWVHFGNSCYAFLDDVMPWINAEVICRVLFHARMLEVENQDENDFIAEQLRARGIQSAWQGINDLLKEGDWVFNSNQQRPTFLPWARGMPDNSNSHEHSSGEDCMCIRNDGRWNDLWCEDIYSGGWKPTPVCEKQIQETDLVG